MHAKGYDNVSKTGWKSMLYVEPGYILCAPQPAQLECIEDAVGSRSPWDDINLSCSIADIGKRTNKKRSEEHKEKR